MAALIPVALAAPANYHTVTPCRILDTRLPANAPALSSGVVRTIDVRGLCGIPAGATSVALNLTVTQGTSMGHLRLSPAGTAPSPVSAINWSAGRTRANNSILQLSAGGQVDALASLEAPGTVHLILDVYGYFVDDVPPVGVDDAATVAEDDPATTIDVLANDNNPDGGGPISIAAVTQPANGTVVITSGGADLTYQPNADYCNAPPATALDTFTYDLAPGTSTATVSVTVNCVNDPPQLAGAGTVTFAEDGPPVAVAPALTVADLDDTNLESATVTINNLLDTGAETLAADTTGTAITAAYVAPTLTLTGTDTVANYELVLRRVTYDNTAGNPDLTSRSVALVASDGTANSNTATATVDLTAANDAPVLTAGGGSPTFTEDGPPVAVDPGLLVTDVDDTNLESAAVTITNLVDTGAEVLAANTAGTAVVANYVAPTLTLTGSDTLANYQQVLRSVTYANSSQNPSSAGRVVSFLANDGTVNSNTVTTTVGVTPVNDAPVLTAGGGSPTFTEDGPPVVVDPGLTAADVDDTNLESATVTITNLLNAGAEVLAANTAGTAIVANYVAPTLTLTGSDTLANYQQVLRSVTYANSSQNPSTAGRVIAFVANDGTANSNTVNTTVGITAVNDAPVLTAGGGSPTFTEGGPPVAVDPGLTAADVDSANLASGTVTITNLQDAGAEFLAATTAGTAITANYVAPTLTLTGSDTLANYQQVLRSVTYANTSDSPSTTPRVVAFQVNDGALASNTVSTTVSVVSVDDAPVLTAGGGSPTFTEDGPPVAVDPGLTVVDADSANLASATVTITNLQDAGAEFLAANTGGTAITANYVAPTLTLTGSDTLANYQQVLRSVTYANNSQNPGTVARSVAFQANDGTSNSNVVSTTVSVVALNDAPVLTAGGGSPTFTENGPPVAVDPGLVAMDVDSANLASATVTITNLLDAGAELLAANTGGTAITANYVAPTLTLTGSDTLANYQQVLRSVTYENTSNSPSTTPRVVAFQANDGALNSNTVSTTVSVVSVDDSPVLTAGGGSPTFTEDGPPVAVDPGLVAMDVDSANLASATVTITNLLDAGAEVLAANTAGTAITANYVAPTLTLSGSDSVANYQQVLRSVTYTNASQSPSTVGRVVAFQANDGTSNSNIVTTTVNVVAANDAPVLTAGGGSPTFTEDGPPVAVDPGLVAVDIDNANLASATVTITNLLDSGAELLAANTAGTAITANYVPPTLTLTGSDSVANYQQVLRSVTYENTSDSPSTTPRVVAFQANDGALNSNIVSTTVSVVAVNDAPVLTAGGGSPTFTEDGPAVAVDPGITVTDNDSTDLASATVTITNLLDAGLEVLAANTAGTSITANYVAPTLTLTGTDTLANYQQVLRSVTYNNTSQNPATTPRAVAFVANDGTDNSNTATTMVSVVRVNDAPVVAGTGTVTFTEDGGPVAVASALTATDVDNTTLASGTVTITNLLDIGLEVLAANTAGTSITANYVAPTLTLTGVDTLANYQQVLRSVTYNNGSQNPNVTNRAVAFQVNDGAAGSNVAVATVQVVAVNDPPVLTTNPITYATAGNTQLHVAGHVLPGVASIADPLSALAKSAPTDVDGPAAPTVVAASGTTGNGGSFDITTTGAFTFVPAAGFTGIDSFSYQVTDSVTPVTGTINITVSSVIWYVRDVTDANNAPGGDGRSTDAFETLNGAQTASGNDHFIFVFAGNTATTPLGGGIVLKDGQKLHGETVGLSVPAFANIVAAGARPHIENTGGDAVSIPATAGNRNAVEVRGLDIQASVNAIDVTASGANTVGVTVINNVISGAGAEGIDINAGSSGLLTATVQTNTIASTGNGFDARRTVAGSSQLLFSANTVTSGGVGILVDGSTGSTTLTGFDNNTVTGATAGTGVMITTATFDATPGGGINQVSGGATAIGVSGNGVGGAGLVLTNVAGELAFADLDVFADGGAALSLSGTGAFNGTTGTQVTVTAGAGTLRATNGAAADVNNATVDLQLGAMSSTSTGTGVSLVSVSDGTVAARFSGPSGSTISSTGGTSFNVNGGNAGISYAGTITNVAAGRTVNVNAWNGDDATDDMSFSGAIDDNGLGIRVTSNLGSRSITFSGGMDVDTTSGNIGLSATTNTNTGGLRISGTNTIDTTNAAALNVTNTVIGTGGLSFVRLSANGGTNGIVLTNTGTTAGLTVTGSGAAPTGGVIQNMTGNGVALTNTRSISLSSMNVTANLGSGIGGDDVTDFSLIGSNVTNNADTATGVEAGIRFDELLGTCAITSSTVSGSSEDNIRITPVSGTLNLTITNSTIGPNSVTTGGNGISLIGNGSATVTATVTGTTFTGNRGTGFLTNYTSTGSHTANVSTSIFRDNGKGLSLASNTNTDLVFNVLNNTEVVRSQSNALELIASADATSAMENRGTFSGNLVGNNNADSGSRDLHGIALDMRGDERALLAVNSNTVRHVDFAGLFISDADFGAVGGPPSDHDLTVRDNVVADIDDNSGFPCASPFGTLIDMRHTTVACIDMAGNTSAESPASCGAAHFRLRQRDTSTFHFERLTDGDGTPGEVLNAVATIQAHAENENDPGSTANITLIAGFTEATNGFCVKP